MSANNIITEELRGFKIQFETKPGIFSEAGIDMGTRLLTENMQVKEGSLVADLGCGTGVIGFVVAKLNKNGHVHLLDSNIRATLLAEQNTILNDFRNVEVFLSDLFSAVGPRTYHYIFSNPPAHLGNKFLEEATVECNKHLKPNGEVWWVVPGHLKPVIQRLFSKYFENHIIVSTGKQHVIIKGIKNG